MFIVCYLAHTELTIPAVQERLSLASPPMVLVTARSAPELISQVQTLPVRVILADLSWPQAVWKQVTTALRQMHSGLPILALSNGPTQLEWWTFADELLRLDDNLDLFLSRLTRTGERMATAPPPQEETPQYYTAEPTAMPASGLPAAVPDAPGLLGNPQFRHFAELFSGMDEDALIESFVAWVQQSCQTSRVIALLRDPDTGTFVCRAHRGLPSTLVPHCVFPQTAPICRWLATTGSILLKDSAPVSPTSEVLIGLDLLQAVAAVPMMFDGQLVGILGLGSRLIGARYGANELEGLFALCGHVAVSLHHCRMHHAIAAQKEMTEHMLGAMPTGTVVVGEDSRIAFVNDSAAAILGKTRAALQGEDLRVLPSPLGDLAYEAVVLRKDIPRREMGIITTGRPVAVTVCALSTSPRGAMLLIEDLSDHKRLEEERERRVDLEVVTNLVHYLAHELRNPLVALSTFGNLAPTRAGDPDFQDFCESVLQTEIRRVNLILEQLLVLTDHVEFQFDTVELVPILDRVTGTEEMQASVVMALPTSLPPLYGDANRLETAITCVLRTISKFAYQQPTPATVRVNVEETQLVLCAEVPMVEEIAPEWLLNPWQQLLGDAEEKVDLGLATAQYIIHQHQGELTASVEENMLRILCRLPLRTGEAEQEEEQYGATESSRRR